MFISKKQLQAIQFAEQVDTATPRFGLYIDENEVAATNGHRLMVVGHNKDLEPSDAVNMFTSPEDENNGPVLPSVLDGDCVRAVLKAWPKVKKSKTLLFHDWAWLTKDQIRMIDENHKVISMPALWLCGKYPDYKQSIPADLESERPVRIGLSARYLGEASYVTDTAGKMLDIRLAWPDTQRNSAVIVGDSEEGHKCTYLVMPMMLDSPAERARQRANFELEHAVASRLTQDSTPLHEHIEPVEGKLVHLYGHIYLRRDIDAFLATEPSKDNDIQQLEDIDLIVPDDVGGER
jgi:hypothetical protein